jgi:hypothetical protein
LACRVKGLAEAITNKILLVAGEEEWAMESPSLPTREEAEAFFKTQPWWNHRIYLSNGTYILPLTLAGQV